MRIGTGTVVFVTGGASGLGLATVLELYKKGASVAVADLDEDAFKNLH